VEFEPARAELRESADGDPLANAALGWSFSEDSVGDIHKPISEHYYDMVDVEKLKSHDCRQAKFHLGMMQKKGKGQIEVTNQPEALRLLKLSASQGCFMARCQLGKCYQNGEGVSKNYHEAVRLFKLAAEQEYAVAQYNLGLCFER